MILTKYSSNMIDLNILRDECKEVVFQFSIFHASEAFSVAKIIHLQAASISS